MYVPRYIPRYIYIWVPKVGIGYLCRRITRMDFLMDKMAYGFIMILIDPLARKGNTA